MKPIIVEDFISSEDPMDHSLRQVTRDIYKLMKRDALESVELLCKANFIYIRYYRSARRFVSARLQVSYGNGETSVRYFPDAARHGYRRISYFNKSPEELTPEDIEYTVERMKTTEYGMKAIFGIK